MPPFEDEDPALSSTLLDDEGGLDDEPERDDALERYDEPDDDDDDDWEPLEYDWPPPMRASAGDP